MGFDRVFDTHNRVVLLIGSSLCCAYKRTLYVELGL